MSASKKDDDDLMMVVGGQQQHQQTERGGGVMLASSSLPLSLSDSSDHHHHHHHHHNRHHHHHHHPQIRHAGRAHVRGKIRRIWRPRYLELWDNGLLRYYELPASADIALQSDKDWDHYNMISKYTLAVYHARILDVTTLRDIHVGLPQASFGFVFRGQRLTHLENNNNTGSVQNIGGGAYYPYTSSIDPSNTTTTIISPVAGLNPMNVQCGGQPNRELPLPEQRDFYCAVSTLEEAQMWVVALQWAASRQLESDQEDLPQQPWWKQEGEESDSSPSSSSSSSDNEIEKDSDLVMVRSSSKSKNRHSKDTFVSPEFAASATGKDTSTVLAVPPISITGKGVNDGATAAAAAAASTTAAPRTGRSFPHQRKNRSGAHGSGTAAGAGFGKVVVSKVVQYRVVRLSGIRFEVAYEIHGMLLRQRIAEQWSMLRTADDMLTLVADLCKELGPSLLDRAQLGPIRRLPRFKDKPSPTDVDKSLSVVDSIVRSLVMDAAMVNTNAMKSFLGLTAASSPTAANVSSTQQLLPSRPQQATAITQLIDLLGAFLPSLFTTSSSRQGLWQVHDSRAILDRKTESLPEHIATDHFVKTWLQSNRNNRPASSSTTGAAPTTPSSSATVDSCVVMFWQRPMVYIGAAGLSAAALVPISQIFHSVPRITLRMDTLLVSWASAAYLGKLYHENVTIPSAAASNSVLVCSSRTKSSRGSAAVTKPTGLTTATANAPKAGDTAVQDILPREPGKLTQLIMEDEDESEASLEESDGEEMAVEDEAVLQTQKALSSPLPEYQGGEAGDGEGAVVSSCWSRPVDSIFHVRGTNYLQDRIKIPSDAAPLKLRGVDIWIANEPMRHIARHPAVLGGKLDEEDTFMVNFLLPFGNFVSYFSVPPLHKFPKKLRNVWTKFLKGDQQYRDARLKLLPVVVDGPWIVKTAVGPGKSPALLGKVIPLQYFFRDPDRTRKGVYEVDVIITASTIAKGILSVVKGHTNYVSIAFAFIIEASEQADLPETVLCSFQMHKIHLEDCPILPECNLDDSESSMTS